ncbi:MAG: hypothetical protein PVI11_08550, partial [Candidatus Aminicenantes bacterium]
MSKRCKPIFLILSGFLAFLMGCDTSIEVSEEPAFYVPKDPPSAQYTVEAKLSVEEKSVNVEAAGSIIFRNPSKQPMSAIALEWSSNPKNILEVFVDGEKLKKIYPEPLNQRVHFFALPLAFSQNDKVELDIQFTLTTKTRDSGDIS